jgi:hypothetical protein
MYFAASCVSGLALALGTQPKGWGCMVNRKLTQAIVIGVAAVAGLFVAHTATAGYKANYNVGITSSVMYGAFGTARNSSDTSQYLMCEVLGYSDGSKLGYCGARTASGTTASCTTTVAGIIDVIQSLDSDSSVNVYYDSSGKCTTVAAYNASYYPPKMQ